MHAVMIYAAVYTLYVWARLILQRIVKSKFYELIIGENEKICLSNFQLAHLTLDKMTAISQTISIFMVKKYRESH